MIYYLRIVTQDSKKVICPRISRHFAVIFFSILCSLHISCATYTDSSAKMREAFYEASYAKALKELDESSVAKSSSDTVLFKMERGSILFAQKKYAQAAELFNEASRKLDQLYSISISKQAASLSISEAYTDYEGEAHERILLPIYAALAYFAAGDLNKAIVEARRSYQVMNKEKDKTEGKGNMQRDTFAHYLSGLIYEAKEEWDSAIVEYRQALSAGDKNTFDGNSGTAMRPVAESLGRLAEFRQRSELITQVKSLYPRLTWTPLAELKRNAELIIVVESGRSPLKYPVDIPVPIDNGVINISFPEYRSVWTGPRSVEVEVDGQSVGSTVRMADIDALAKQALSERRARDVTRMIARVVAKDQASRAAGRALGPVARLATSVAGAVTERADTRSWTLLPNSLQVLRVPVKADKELKVRIDTNGRPSGQFFVKLRPAEKKLLVSQVN